MRIIVAFLLLACLSGLAESSYLTKRAMFGQDKMKLIFTADDLFRVYLDGKIVIQRPGGWDKQLHTYSSKGFRFGSNITVQVDNLGWNAGFVGELKYLNLRILTSSKTWKCLVSSTPNNDMFRTAIQVIKKKTFSYNSDEVYSVSGKQVKLDWITPVSLGFNQSPRNKLSFWTRRELGGKGFNGLHAKAEWIFGNDGTDASHQNPSNTDSSICRYEIPKNYLAVVADGEATVWVDGQQVTFTDDGYRRNWVGVPFRTHWALPSPIKVGSTIAIKATNIGRAPVGNHPYDYTCVSLGPNNIIAVALNRADLEVKCKSSNGVSCTQYSSRSDCRNNRRQRTSSRLCRSNEYNIQGHYCQVGLGILRPPINREKIGTHGGVMVAFAIDDYVYKSGTDWKCSYEADPAKFERENRYWQTEKFDDRAWKNAKKAGTNAKKIDNQYYKYLKGPVPGIIGSAKWIWTGELLADNLKTEAHVVYCRYTVPAGGQSISLSETESTVSHHSKLDQEILSELELEAQDSINEVRDELSMSDDVEYDMSDKQQHH